jgi:hypothetical protein
MKVCWSLMYIMLICAESQQQVSCFYLNYVLLNMLNNLQAVDEFICKLRLREVNPEKWHNIATLALDEEEWTHVCLFSNILQVCLFCLHFKHHVMF